MRVLRERHFKSKLTPIPSVTNLPLPKDEFYPARYLISPSRRSNAVSEPVMGLPHETAPNALIEDASEATRRNADDPHRVKLVHTQQPRWLQNFRIKLRRRELNRRNTRLRRSGPIPIEDTLSVKGNKFLVAKALIHPTLSMYSFQEVASLMSNLWNDYENCDASDYFTILTAYTAISPGSIKNLPMFITLNDYYEFKVADIPFASAVRDMVSFQRGQF